MKFTSLDTAVKSAGSLLVGATLLVSVAAHSQALGSYDIDETKISVSGISSGGYMAQQFHVAYSKSVMGAGIIAGGPYYCAEGSLTLGLYRCMDTRYGAIDVPKLVKKTRDFFKRNAIDDPANLNDAKVYLYHGTQDQTVKQPVMKALVSYYEALVKPANIVSSFEVASGHGMITADYGDPCPVTQSPYINDCNIDVPGAILAHIYGPLKNKVEARGQLLTFSQSEFTNSLIANSLNPNGHVYVPTACATGSAKCKLHVAFHGCKQYEQEIGDLFYTKSGYNEWGEANDIVVLYPQAIAETVPLSPFQYIINPNGCWDWWGYADTKYYTRNGGQMKAVKAMIDQLIKG